jgi:hypothetical protein
MRAGALLHGQSVAWGATSALYAATEPRLASECRARGAPGGRAAKRLGGSRDQPRDAGTRCHGPASNTHPSPSRAPPRPAPAPPSKNPLKGRGGCYIGPRYLQAFGDAGSNTPPARRPTRSRAAPPPRGGCLTRRPPSCWRRAQAAPRASARRPARAAQMQRWTRARRCRRPTRSPPPRSRRPRARSARRPRPPLVARARRGRPRRPRRQAARTTAPTTAPGPMPTQQWLRRCRASPRRRGWPAAAWAQTTRPAPPRRAPRWASWQRRSARRRRSWRRRRAGVGGRGGGGAAAGGGARGALRVGSCAAAAASRGRGLATRADGRRRARVPLEAAWRLLQLWPAVPG